ncbi:calcium/proton exchanger [Klebsiella pneumoniae]|uniref:Calcium/proton exchanger n=1 Tax=Klebsiella pneumoniae TaxID=573 RepID=A0A3S4GV63_KLEPN|nr:calcium/proton exchanger [Klebsiella pneumoniae]
MVTLIAFLTGNELRFGLGAPEMVVMVASLVLCHISFSTGRTNVLNGAAHIGAVRRLSDDHFRLTPLSHPAESGRKKACRF